MGLLNTIPVFISRPTSLLLWDGVAQEMVGPGVAADEEVAAFEVALGPDSIGYNLACLMA